MNWRPIRGWTRLLHEREMKADSMPERLLIGPGSPPSLDPVYPELSPPLEPCPRTGRRGCRSWPQAGCWAVSSPPAVPGCGKSPSVWACTTWQTWAAARRDDADPKAGFQARLHFTWVSHPRPETLARLGQFCRKLSMSG